MDKEPMVPPDVAERLNALMDQVNELSKMGNRAAERSATFYDRLTFLNAGTIALAFTVVTTLANQAVTKHFVMIGGSNAISAFTLLVLSVFASLLRGISGANLATTSELQLRCLFLSAESQRIKGKLQYYSGQEVDFLDSTIMDLAAQAKKYGQQVRIQHWWSLITGTSALLLTVIAYYKLLHFLSLNLHVLVG